MPIAQMILSASAIVGAGILILFGYVAFVSWRERQFRAVSRSLLLGILLPLPFWAAAWIPFPGQVPSAAILLALAIGLPSLMLIPAGNIKHIADDQPKKRFDERDIMFSRVRLQPDTARFDEYYQHNPGKKELDDKFRQKPGLMSPQAAHADPIAFAAADASFETVGAFHPLLDRELAYLRPLDVIPEKMSAFVKLWGKKLGAVSVGITELKDYHLYSTIGRGEHYGNPVTLKHRYAIALTVEMNHAAVASAPYAPIVMESAQQYLNAGAIAVQLAEFIHALGYPARAHIDGSYRVICPLVARDAGLGEIGRMGLLMTPELGPRVRLAVVTTDLPLVLDQVQRDTSVLDLCTRCKKCAETCPSKAIPFGDREQIEGALRWQINSEACFTYWCMVGTDCGRCMSVCPYSHPDNLMHNFIRFGVRQSVIFRQFALIMDNFFYGRKPVPRPVPDWIKSVPRK